LNTDFPLLKAGLLFLSVTYLGYFLCGKLVEVYDVRVNYTRKLMHFVTFFLPWAIQQSFGFEKSAGVAVLAACVVPLHLLLFVKPMRRRYPIVAAMFRGLDRPEDRPYTLRWLMTQFAASYTVYALLYAAMIGRGVTEWMIIPLLIIGIGDGLAEPVGVAFGRHSYVVSALNGERYYRRTWEGSSMVFLAGVFTLIACYTHFSPLQLAAALLVIPITATLAEAVAPHTWDAPIMLLVMGLELLAISYLEPLSSLF
jgi:phytol kinase